MDGGNPMEPYISLSGNPSLDAQSSTMHNASANDSSSLITISVGAKDSPQYLLLPEQVVRCSDFFVRGLRNDWLETTTRVFHFSEESLETIDAYFRFLRLDNTPFCEHLANPALKHQYATEMINVYVFADMILDDDVKETVSYLLLRWVRNESTDTLFHTVNALFDLPFHHELHDWLATLYWKRSRIEWQPHMQNWTPALLSYMQEISTEYAETSSNDRANSTKERAQGFLKWWVIQKFAGAPLKFRECKECGRVHC
ncbi:hypothetical protein EJ04DRAFT_586264 [Polyplosphaeria fusca]|uniref:BTB domain-containing protein n=1 Tax=Polyplosphaeria fusca TaxID=682080 RepID=A0A9P4UVY0_9PLEO|nr:hypothetical protein EJ04DRAFT_586264 [Polyplosphaeria fusca]